MSGFPTESCGCPGSMMLDLRDQDAATAATMDESAVAQTPSQLRQWPIQLHLVSPNAPYFQGADVLLAADCTAFALGAFHGDYLKGKALAIACPKLDRDQEVYLEKIKGLAEDARINTLTVLIMQVPCCRGLAALASRAIAESSRKVPVKVMVVSPQGEMLSEEWL
jgi:hypothetical protein